MNHLQKKCLVASAGFHGVLIGVTIFGAAFFVPKEKTVRSIPIKVYYPEQVVDTPTTGGKPTVKAIAPIAPPIQTIIVAPPAPQPIPQPVQPPKPTPAPTPAFKDEPPAPEPPKIQIQSKPKHDKPAPKKKEEPPPDDDPTPQPTEAPPVKKKHVVEIDKTSLTPVTRESSHPSRRNKPVEDDEDQKAADKAAADFQAAQDRARATRVAAAANAVREIGQVARNLTSETSATTKVEIAGHDGPDVFSANYSDIVGSAYREAWRSHKPASISERTEKVQVKVTIARNGRVISKRILKPSGNAEMDRSIERALDAVKNLEPFPAGSKDVERSFIINFDLNAE